MQCSEGVEQDITADNMKYKHELSGDIREGQGNVVKNHEICGYSVYRLEKYGESYQVKTCKIRAINNISV